MLLLLLSGNGDWDLRKMMFGEK